MSHFNYKKMIETYTQPFTFIHIGKTGGSTVGSFLKKHLFIKEIHNRTPVYNPNTKFIIWIRDPIKRFISAFYWSKHRCSCKNNVEEHCLQFNCNKEEEEVINKYETVNEISNKLYDKNGNLVNEVVNDIYKLNHTNTGHAWYLLHNDFIHKAKDNIIFVGTQLSLL